MNPPDNKETLPPAWAVQLRTEFAKVIFGTSATRAGDMPKHIQDAMFLPVDRILALIAAHAPPPVPVSPPPKTSENVTDCRGSVSPPCKERDNPYLRNVLRQMALRVNDPTLMTVTTEERQAILEALNAPPCKEREELLVRLKMLQEFFPKVEGHYLADFTKITETVTDAITFISGAAAVARKE